MFVEEKVSLFVSVFYFLIYLCYYCFEDVFEKERMLKMERNDTEIAWFLAGFVLTIGVCLIIILYVPGSGVISPEVQINALISLCFFVSILMAANLWKNKRERQKSPLDEVDWLEKIKYYKNKSIEK